MTPDEVRIGMEVRVPKGTLVWSTNPRTPDGWYPAGRTYTVEVFSVTRHAQRGPLVSWVGSGGYWMDAAIADVEAAA